MMLIIYRKHACMEVYVWTTFLKFSFCFSISFLLRCIEYELSCWDQMLSLLVSPSIVNYLSYIPFCRCHNMWMSLHSFIELYWHSANLPWIMFFTLSLLLYICISITCLCNLLNQAYRSGPVQ